MLSFPSLSQTWVFMLVTLHSLPEIFPLPEKFQLAKIATPPVISLDRAV